MERTPKKSLPDGARVFREPEGLQVQKTSAQKRRRLSYSQTPVTPAKGDVKQVEASTEEPCIDLYESAEEGNADVQLQPHFETQVLKLELESLKAAHSKLQAKGKESEAEVVRLKAQVRHLHGEGLDSCSEQELHEIGKVLSRAQGRVAVHKTRQAGRINRRLSL